MRAVYQRRVAADKSRTVTSARFFVLAILIWMIRRRKCLSIRQVTVPEICVVKNSPEKTSQRLLAEKMQIKGIDMDKTAIKRIENGERYVTDIELKAFSELFCVSADFYWNNKPMRFLMQFTRQRNTGRSRIAECL